MISVAILFARADSIYKTLPGYEVYDLEREALSFAGGMPVVAHPPCRAWGMWRHRAKPRPGEKELAIWAVAQVRRWGGVLEHPRTSKLWPTLALPLGEQTDAYGGFTLSVNQHWWGHRAEKKTLLYCCGLKRAEVPQIPICLDEPTHTISSVLRKHQAGHKPVVPKAEREATPPAFAEWLAELARRCQETPHGQVDSLQVKNLEAFKA